MNMPTFCEIKHMNKFFFSKAMYMIGVGFIILEYTHVPKFTPSYPCHPFPETVGQASDSIMALTYSFNRWVGA